VRVTNTPDVLNDAVAELAIGLMIALGRRIVVADQFVRAGKWPSTNFGFSSEMTGKTIGILGLGRIGKENRRPRPGPQDARGLLRPPPPALRASHFL
jgi:lactate dehydrogenase-like 2-hydroxyacid dehydrogenase